MKGIKGMEKFIVKDELQKDVDNSERIWTVYVHIVPKDVRSSPDKDDYYDKYYVGITSRDPKYRWRNGEGYKDQVFYNPIKKYGWDNIQHEIVAERLTKDEACNLEKKLIKELDCLTDRYGYNNDPGGGVAKGYKQKSLTDEEKQIRVYEQNNKFKTNSKFVFFGENDSDTMHIILPSGHTIICQRRHYEMLQYFNIHVFYNNGKLRKIVCYNPLTRKRPPHLCHMIFRREFDYIIQKDPFDFRPKNCFLVSSSIFQFYNNIIKSKDNLNYLIRYPERRLKHAVPYLYKLAVEDERDNKTVPKFDNIEDARKERDRLLFKIGQIEPAIAYALSTFYTGQPCLYEGSPHFIKRKE